MIKCSFSKALLGLTILVCYVIPAFAQVDTGWVRRYNGPGNGSDEAWAIATDASGNVFVTGGSYGVGTGLDYATIKYDPKGDTVWVRRYNGPGSSSDRANALAVDASGNVYVTGESEGAVTHSDCATIKYYPNGDTAWVRRYDGPDNDSDIGYDIAVDISGNVYVTGKSYVNIMWWSPDYVTIKYYPNGDTAWVRRYNGPGNYIDWSHAIAIDASGNVYVTGESHSSFTDAAYATAKYDSLGNELWVKRYDGQEGNYDCAHAIFVDDSGSVYVTGYSHGGGTSYDCATIKYYADGDTAWVRRYNGPGNASDGAWDLAVDDLCNVYVTGWSSVSWVNQDCVTIKYDSSGNEQWIKRYQGVGDSTDAARGIAVDVSGNVYSTGLSHGGSTSFDCATMKYYANGDSAWAMRYDGPENDIDETYSIAIDSSGNVFVTGRSLSSDTGYDYVTIKYVQEGVFVGEENQDNIVHSFALSQNYPNPFNPQTTIEYTLNSPCKVTLKIHNIQGQLIKTLVDMHQGIGTHQVTWDSTNDKGKKVASGVYFYRIQAGDFTKVKKTVLLK